MSLQNDERTITILRIISEGKLGTNKTGLFARIDDIVEEMGDKHATKQIIDGFLLPKKYIRKINDKFKSVTGNELDYKAYQITQLGITFLSGKGVLNSSQTSSLSAPDIGVKMKERLESLINETDAVLKTHTPNPPNMIGFATLDTEKYQQWKTSSENIIQSICGSTSNYLENFKKETKSGGRTVCVKAGRGILVALKEDINAGVYGNLQQNATAYDVSAASVVSDTVSLKINEKIYSHIRQYLESKDYFHAVEEAYKVVREKLREITGKEAATNVFNMNAENDKYHEEIFGEKVEPGSPQYDFYRGVGYLNLAIQFLRNEKSHSLATTLDKNLAIHYISLASLAYDLISGSEK